MNEECFFFWSVWILMDLKCPEWSSAHKALRNIWQMNDYIDWRVGKHLINGLLLFDCEAEFKSGLRDWDHFGKDHE